MRVGSFFLVGVAWVSLAIHVSAQEFGSWTDVTIDPSPPLSLLAEALSFGEVVSLDAPEPLNLNVRARLVSVPREGACVPDGHMICAHDYLLALGAYREGPEARVVGLGILGEVTAWEWSELESPSVGILRLDVLSAASHVFEYNRRLTRSTHRYELRVSWDEVSVLSREDVTNESGGSVF